MVNVLLTVLVALISVAIARLFAWVQPKTGAWLVANFVVTCALTFGFVAYSMLHYWGMTLSNSTIAHTFMFSGHYYYHYKAFGIAAEVLTLAAPLVGFVLICQTSWWKEENHA